MTLHTLILLLKLWNVHSCKEEVKVANVYIYYICLIVPGRARDDLVSGLGNVAGSCARICLMAYTLFSSPRSLSSRSSWLRWSFPTSSSVQEFIGKSGSCICRSGFPPPRFNLPSAAAVSRTIRLLGEGDMWGGESWPTCCPWASCAAPSSSWPSSEAPPTSPLAQGTPHASLFFSPRPPPFSGSFALA